MIEISVPHALGRDAARAKLATLFVKHSVSVESKDGGYSGTLEKQFPLVGRARAEFDVHADSIELRVVQAPPFPSAETLGRMLRDELVRALA